MKGFFVKDYLLIKNMKWMIFILPVVTLIIAVVVLTHDVKEKTISMIADVLALIAAFLSMAPAILVTSFDWGSKFLYLAFVSPVKRKDYLKAKYIIQLIICAAFLAEALICDIFILAVGGVSGIRYWLLMLLAVFGGLFGVYVFMVLWTGLIVKYDNIWWFSGIFLIDGLISRLFDAMSFGKTFSEINTIGFLAAIIIGAIVVYFKSYKWIEQKEV